MYSWVCGCGCLCVRIDLLVEFVLLNIRQSRLDLELRAEHMPANLKRAGFGWIPLTQAPIVVLHQQNKIVFWASDSLLFEHHPVLYAGICTFFVRYDTLPWKVLSGNILCWRTRILSTKFLMVDDGSSSSRERVSNSVINLESLKKLAAAIGQMITGYPTYQAFSHQIYIVIENPKRFGRWLQKIYLVHLIKMVCLKVIWSVLLVGEGGHHNESQCICWKMVGCAVRFVDRFFQPIRFVWLTVIDVTH